MSVSATDLKGPKSHFRFTPRADMPVNARFAPEAVVREGFS